MSDHGERLKAGVAEIIKRAEPGRALIEAERLDDLARYLGQQSVDLYAELTGDNVVDESFLRSVAAEEAERRAWSLAEILVVAEILANLGIMLLTGSNTAMIDAGFTAATKLIGELA